MHFYNTWEHLYWRYLDFGHFQELGTPSFLVEEMVHIAPVISNGFLYGPRRRGLAWMHSVLLLYFFIFPFNSSHMQIGRHMLVYHFVNLKYFGDYIVFEPCKLMTNRTFVGTTYSLLVVDELSFVSLALDFFKWTNFVLGMTQPKSYAI